MEGHLRDGVVRVEGDARQRFYDSRGYGRPRGGNTVDLAPVEAAHLLSRGDLDAVVDERGGETESLGFRGFLARTGAVLSFVVYKDLRDRGFYLSPARDGWLPEGVDAAGVDLVVYPRGSGPWDAAVAYRVRVTSERDPVEAASLGDCVLAVVDEDGELTYFETARETASGTVLDDLGADGSETGDDPNAGVDPYAPPAGLDGALHDDRVLLWDPPEGVYECGFYGQRLYGRNADSGPLQLSLVEAAYLARLGSLDVDEGRVVERGRSVEGERFDRRLRAYSALRSAGAVPKSGFKFGADFRVYDGFSTVSDLDHSDRLVRVAAREHTVFPRDISLDVRLSGGVRKRMVFALTDANEGIDWLSVARLTP